MSLEPEIGRSAPALSVSDGGRSNLARQTPINAAVTAAMSLLTAGMLWPHLPSGIVIAWLAASWTVIALPLLRWMRRRHDKTSRPISRRMRWRAVLYALLAGGMWGTLAVLAEYLPVEFAHLLLVVVCGMVAGATTTLAIIPIAAASYIAAALLPWIVHFALNGQLDYILLSAMLLTYGIAMASAARAIYLSHAAKLAQNFALSERLRQKAIAWELLSATTEAFALFDAEQRLLLWNERLLAAFDLPPDAIRQGLSLAELASLGARPTDASAATIAAETWLEELRELASRSPRPIVREYSNGHWLRSSASRTADGHLVFSHVDITEHKRSEEALRHSEHRFRDFAESAGDWLWETDAGQRFTYMSDNVERIVKVPAHWHYGKTRRDLLGPHYDRAVWDEHLHSLDHHRPFRDFTYLRIGPGIEPKWLRVSGKPVFDEQGIFQGHRGAASDVTQEVAMRERLRENEALLRDAIENLGGGFVLYDRDDRFVTCNRRLKEMFPDIADLFIPGASYSEMAKTITERRQLAQAIEGLDAYVGMRAQVSVAGEQTSEVEWCDGRIIRFEDRRTSDGGMLGLRTDVTALR